jgi:hypothetical protein
VPEADQAADIVDPPVRTRGGGSGLPTWVAQPGESQERLTAGRARRRGDPGRDAVVVGHRRLEPRLARAGRAGPLGERQRGKERRSRRGAALATQHLRARRGSLSSLQPVLSAGPAAGGRSSRAGGRPPGRRRARRDPAANRTNRLGVGPADDLTGGPQMPATPVSSATYCLPRRSCPASKGRRIPTGGRQRPRRGHGWRGPSRRPTHAFGRRRRCCQQAEHPAHRPRPYSGKPTRQPSRLERRRYGARSNCSPSAAASAWKNRSTRPWRRQRRRLPPRLASPSARPRCSRWSPRAGPTGRSARHCSSPSRPPACTSQGSSPN